MVGLSLRERVPIFAGVDYASILAKAEKEAQVILWDGGNNDFPFLRPSLHLVIVDPHRPGHELSYHPGEVNFRMADAYILTKVGSASSYQIDQVLENIHALKPSAPVVMADLDVTVGQPELIELGATLGCGTAATATPPPTAGASPPETASPATATPPPEIPPTPIVQPTVTSVPSDIVSARDSITLAIAAEPVTLDPLGYVGGTSSSVVKDNMVDSLTWQSGDDLRIVPTTATVGWEQLTPDRWRFQLREGVKFHNGEVWNAAAALPSLDFQGVDTNENSSFGYTGGHTSEVVDEFTVDINCDQPCPIFPNTAFFLEFTAPEFFTNSTEDERALRTVGFGPYQQVEWSHGVSLTMEAYDDYVPSGNHFEFQKPFIQEARWLWRAETTVMAAMVQAGEADIAWDVGVDAIGILDEDQIRSGGSAEVYGFWINTLWHPELTKKQVRQAMVHAINCREIVETLFGGLPPCRGNIMWPGVIGSTERNTAPYEYNPDLLEA